MPYMPKKSNKKEVSSERKEAWFRIIVAIVSGIVLSVWQYLICIFAIINWLIVVFNGKRNEELASVVGCGIFMADDDLCVTVFRCKPADVRRVLIGLYWFVKDLEGVKSLHFITRDHLKDDVVVKGIAEKRMK